MESNTAIDSWEESQIRQWQASQTQKIRIKAVTTGDVPDNLFTGFCKELKRLAPCIDIKMEKDESASAPAIHIGDRIVYHAVPLGPELPPFLTALGLQNQAVPGIAEEVGSILNNLNLPVFLKLFIAPHCPFCPGVAGQLIALAAANDRIRLSIVDGTLFQDLAAKDRIKAAPTLLMDRFRWTGAIPIPEVIRIMAERDPADLGPETIRNILQGGGASEVVMMMRKAGKIFPAFFELLTDAKWTVRLGAMVVMEELIETDIALACRAIQPLREQFNSWDDSVKGDMVYILGEIGNPEALPLLEDALTRTENHEVATAVEEAILAIRRKTPHPV